jgi:hypothetical protein
MSATLFTFEKEYDRVVNAYYLRPLEKSKFRSQCFFYIETIPIDRERQRSTKMAVEGKIFIIIHNKYKPPAGFHLPQDYVSPAGLLLIEHLSLAD